jgi:hypothetical protein
MQVAISSIVLFDSYNPAAPKVRATYKQAIRAGESPSLSNVTDYPDDHPQITFILAHMLHSMKLMSKWKLRPFTPENGDIRTVPPVYFFTSTAWLHR